MVESKQNDKRTIYLVDTNVLIYDPEVVFKFEDGCVGISIAVLEELDKLKLQGTEIGRNARAVIRALDALHKEGALARGPAIDSASRIQILFEGTSEDKQHGLSLEPTVYDNRILSLAYALQCKGYPVVFVSQDINARLKAHALSIVAQGYYKKELVAHETIYKGWVRISVAAGELKKDNVSFLIDYAKGHPFMLNQFIILESQHNQFNYKIYKYLGAKSFKLVESAPLYWTLKPRNPQQQMALDLLLDDDISFVILYGPAGTGKTFLALLAGLFQVINKHSYERMVISRPVVPLGRDMGYLPGTLEEKLRSWMLPIYDNIDCIVHEMGSVDHLTQIDREQKKGKSRRHDRTKKTKDAQVGFESLEDLLLQGMIKLEAITYMRGRSIPYQYILIDEAQNLSLHEVKTLISRVGKESKLVLTGDPYQIDTASLDFNTNGLVLAGERFKGQSLFGAVYLETSERSKLSELAGTLL